MGGKGLKLFCAFFEENSKCVAFFWRGERLKFTVI